MCPGVELRDPCESFPILLLYDSVVIECTLAESVCQQLANTTYNYGEFACVRFLHNFISAASFPLTLFGIVNLVISPSIISQRKMSFLCHPSSCPITTSLLVATWAGSYKHLRKLITKRQCWSTCSQYCSLPWAYLTCFPLLVLSHGLDFQNKCWHRAKVIKIT